MIRFDHVSRGALGPHFSPMILPIWSSTAVGVTPISAFDAALTEIGLGDVNLLSLSSVIPAGATISVNPPAMDLGVGDIVHCVMAEQRAMSGSVAAGVAWAVDAEGRGGIFLEAHHEDVDRVRSDLELGMAEMIERRPYLDLSAGPEFEIVHTSSDQPCCALVVAFYEHHAVTGTYPG